MNKHVNIEEESGYKPFNPTDLTSGEYVIQFATTEFGPPKEAVGMALDIAGRVMEAGHIGVHDLTALKDHTETYMKLLAIGKEAFLTTEDTGWPAFLIYTGYSGDPDSVGTLHLYVTGEDGSVSFMSFVDCGQSRFLCILSGRMIHEGVEVHRHSDTDEEGEILNLLVDSASGSYLVHRGMALTGGYTECVGDSDAGTAPTIAKD